MRMGRRVMRRMRTRMRKEERVRSWGKMMILFEERN
jgi:hypothetical protein